MQRKMVNSDRQNDGINGFVATSDIDTNQSDIETIEFVRTPLQPSSAYLDSQKRANNGRVSASTRAIIVRPGFRTIAAAVLLFFGGIILVISGTVVYSDTSQLVSKGQGLDMLVIGAIMLLPGSYGVINLYGSWRRWNGYTYDSMPTME
mmetsp:Transcript_26025/g.24871  ORF Transcript_26025/g.24871 Transcript_26025/m.24871 type:complete len:149 (-) Transcript_26025:120-566(-)